MPYAMNAELPEPVQKAYSAKCQTAFRKAFNAAFTEYEGDEAKSMGTAHKAAKGCMGESATKADELKAEPMDSGQLDRWLSGKIPRRILPVPFYGKLSGSLWGYADDKGRDLDGEYFDADSDLYGPFPSLRASRDRMVDFHHEQDPTGIMKGAILGHIVLDEIPEDEGLWADFWANAGERRLRLVADLEKRGAQLFGSTQAIRGAIRKAADGHIEVWPIKRHTITTSPQNTLAVVPPLKALLAADDIDGIGWPALRATLAGLDAERSLRKRFPDAGHGLHPSGMGVGKAGRVLSRKNEALVAEIAERAERLLVQLRKLQTEREQQGDSTT